MIHGSAGHSADRHRLLFHTLTAKCLTLMILPMNRAVRGFFFSQGTICLADLCLFLFLSRQCMEAQVFIGMYVNTT